MKKNLQFIISFALLLTIFGCTKDEITTTTPDLRNNTIGNYNFNTKTFIIDIENKLVLSDSSNLDLKLEKGSTLSDIKFIDSTGKLFVQGSNFSEILSATKGYKFDIADQQFEGVTYKGYNYFTVDGKGYHGNYNSTNKKVSFAFTFKLNDIDFVLTAEGTKK